MPEGGRSPTFRLSIRGGLRYNLPSPLSRVKWAILVCKMAGTMKFSEVPPYPYTCRSLRRVRTGKMRDFSDLEFSAFADAASLRIRSMGFAVAHKVSRFRPFISAIGAGSQTELSPQHVRTRRSRDRPATLPDRTNSSLVFTTARNASLNCQVRPVSFRCAYARRRSTFRRS
jgi:hypothetical protein